MRACFVIGTVGFAGASEGARSRPPRADAQPPCADRASRVDLRELAAPEQRVVLGYRPVQVELRVVHEAALQLSHEDLELAPGRGACAPARAGEAVPGPGKGQEVRARSPAMRGQHRAHAAGAVHVGARDDPLARLHALEHRLARGGGQAVDRAPQIFNWCAAGV
jgi:hypothetical protein